MRAPKPPCETILRWLKDNGLPTAPLTGTDTRALKAAVMIIECHAFHTCYETLESFQRMVKVMQPKTRELAFHAIAHVMDWSDRETIWKLCNLPPIENRSMCWFEPGGTQRRAA